MTDYDGKGKEFMPSKLPTQNSYTEGNIGNFLENDFLPHTSLPPPPRLLSILCHIIGQVHSAGPLACPSCDAWPPSLS